MVQLVLKGDLFVIVTFKKKLLARKCRDRLQVCDENLYDLWNANLYLWVFNNKNLFLGLFEYYVLRNQSPC